MANFFLLLGAFAILFIGIEVVLRLFSAKADSTRRVGHALAGVITAALPYYLSFSRIVLLGLVLMLLALTSKRAGLFRSIHGVARRTHGELYFPASIVLVGLLFPERSAFTYCFLVLGLADGAASLIGSRIGTKPYRFMRPEKSREGGIAFFAVTAVLGLWLGMGLIPALFAALLLTLVEGALTLGFDNLALPSVAALLFIFLR